MPKPVPVKIIRFREPTDGAGFSVASALSTTQNNRPTRYTLHYLPMIRHHRIVFTPNTGDPQVTYVPESKVMSWIPGDSDELWEEITGERMASAPPKAKSPIGSKTKPAQA